MKKLIVRALIGLVSLCLISFVSGLAVLFYFSIDLPKISSLKDYRPPLPSRILSRDGVVLAEIGVEHRELVNYTDIPKLIVNSFLAAEDANFFTHQGVDFLGLTRAMLKNIKAGRIVQGGSTITQQVAKSLLLSHKRS